MANSEKWDIKERQRPYLTRKSMISTDPHAGRRISRAHCSSFFTPWNVHEPPKRSRVRITSTPHGVFGLKRMYRSTNGFVRVNCAVRNCELGIATIRHGDSHLFSFGHIRRPSFPSNTLRRRAMYTFTFSTRRSRCLRLASVQCNRCDADSDGAAIGLVHPSHAACRCQCPGSGNEALGEGDHLPYQFPGYS